MPPEPPRGPLQGLQDLSQLLQGKPQGMGTFLRGLVLGAFVGAALAGGAFWRRRKRPKVDKRQGL
jgi:hypothetical protein